MGSAVVPTHELDRPAGPAQNQNGEIADGGGPGVAPIGDDLLRTRWRWGRPGSRVGVAERVLTLMRAHARHLADTIGAVGGDDVIGPAVVEGLGVHGMAARTPSAASAWVILGVHVVSPHVSSRFRVTLGIRSQKPISAMGLTRGFTLTDCNAGSNLS
jgi:hypothetical protein